MAWKTEVEIREQGKLKSLELEAPGIDPGTSHMLSERSTTWATPPVDKAWIET